MMGLCSEVFRDDVVFAVNECDDEGGGGGGDDLRLDEGGSGIESSSGILFMSMLPSADIVSFFRFCKEEEDVVVADEA